MNSHTTLRRGRSLHLVDIENLMGGPTADTERIRTTWESYATLVQPGDAVVMGGSEFTVEHSAFVLPRSIRWVMRHGGKDAADIALLVDGLQISHAAERYDWLFIGSADRSFVLAAVEAKINGMKVWSVSGIGEGNRVEALADIRSRVKLPARGASSVTPASRGDNTVLADFARAA